MNKTLELIAFI